MIRAGLLAATALAALVAATIDPSQFEYQRLLTLQTGSRVRFEPDGRIYAHTRPDLPDLRILDADGAQVPWRPLPLAEAVAPRPVTLVARGTRAGVVSVVVDRAPAQSAVDRIELDIPDKAFVGVAEVLGSNTGAEASYARLSRTQIYAVRGAVAARSTTAVFPATDYRYLLVRARGVTAIAGARVARDPREAPLRAVAARATTRDGPRETIVRLDLGFANVPVDAVSVTARTPRFVRQVSVEGSNGGGAFVPIGGGRIARYKGVRLERVDVFGRQRYLRVRIRNGDDAPLAGLRVAPQARSRAILLADGHPSPFRLYYGAATIAPPQYDFAQLPAASTGFEQARDGSLGPEQPNASFDAPGDSRTFFERNDGLVQVLLVVAALVVAGAGVLALRRRA